MGDFIAILRGIGVLEPAGDLLGFRFGPNSDDDREHLGAVHPLKVGLGEMQCGGYIYPGPPFQQFCIWTNPSGRVPPSREVPLKIPDVLTV